MVRLALLTQANAEKSKEFFLRMLKPKILIKDTDIEDDKK